MIAIKTYHTRAAAELAKSVLAAEGIDAVIFADDAGGMRPEMALSFGGVQLKVPDEDRDKALEILGETSQVFNSAPGTYLKTVFSFVILKGAHPEPAYRQAGGNDGDF